MKKNPILKTFAALVMAAAVTVSTAACSASAAGGNAQNSGSDTITVVWYPNESAADYQAARDEYGKLIEQATGKKVEQKLTTDYSIAIEALASGSAQICFMGAQGYIQAKDKNDAVMPLFVNSGDSGTLDDAIYYSWLSAPADAAANYQKDGAYSIEGIQGKRISFVSNSSTSGFKVPTSNIIAAFGAQDKWKDLTADDLAEGGTDKFFSEVLFGGSHQGSAVNLLTGKADVAAFCDTELITYVDLASGTANKAGAVYQVKDGATAPFDTLVGKQFTVIQSTPVLNGPFAYNSETLSADDVKKIKDLFLSDTVTNNTLIFVPEDSDNVGMFKQKGENHFVEVEDAWYNPIRELGK